MISAIQHPSSHASAASDAASPQLVTAGLNEGMAAVKLDTQTSKAANKSHSDPDLSKDYSRGSLSKEEEERLEVAATRIQSVYRGYQ